MGKKEKTDGNSGHYVIASSRPPECRPLERRTLVPIPLIIPILIRDTNIFLWYRWKTNRHTLSLILRFFQFKPFLYVTSYFAMSVPKLGKG